jgi:hypothetical protein
MGLIPCETLDRVGWGFRNYGVYLQIHWTHVNSSLSQLT